MCRSRNSIAWKRCLLTHNSSLTEPYGIMFTLQFLEFVTVCLQLKVCYLVEILQSNQVKRIAQHYINEYLIRMLNPLVVVDFRFIWILACVMSSELTFEIVMKFLNSSVFLEFDVNVFKAILSIQRFFQSDRIQRGHRKKTSLLITHMKECRFEIGQWKTKTADSGLQTTDFLNICASSSPNS